MTMTAAPQLIILHDLPGRLRLQLPEPPHDLDLMISQVKNHPGIRTIDVSPISGTTLIRFDPGEVRREEIILRFALFVSLEKNGSAVRIYSRAEEPQVARSAFTSGLMLLLVTFLRLIHSESRSLEWVAGLGTIGAVLQHAWDEVRKEGNFHPEVLSLIYLLISLNRGNIHSASALTWLTAFGRHLLKPAVPAVEVRPQKTGEKRIEMSLSPVRPEEERGFTLSVLPALIKYLLTGDASAMQGDLIKGIRDVSQKHGDVIEGLGELGNGVSLQMNF